MSHAPLADALDRAARITVLTGAGVSAESGIPTFRDAQTGLWARYRAEQLATPEAFAATPQLVWDWYAWRRSLVEAAQPNGAHRALARLQAARDGLILITQNVDGLHQRAGSRDVVELHGSLLRSRCSREGTRVRSWAPEPRPPLCRQCGAALRPDVVWFGETLPAAALERAVEASRGCDAFLCVGTSGLVQPAASLPLLALDAGAMLVEVNPRPTPLTPRAHYFVGEPAGKALPALFDALCS